MVDVEAVLRVDIGTGVAARILRAHPELLDRLPGQLQAGRPAHEPPAVVRHLLRPVVEMALRHLLAAFACLVRTEMDDRHVRRGCERAELVDELAQNLLRPFVGEIAEARRLAERQRMARHVELGDDRHAVPLRVREYVLELRLCVELPDLTREGLLLLELGILLRLKPPAVVVRQMPVEHVELVGREHSDHVLNRLDTLVVASAVEHEAAVFERRPVDDGAVGDRPRPGELLQLRERRARVALSLLVAGERRLPLVHNKLVGAGSGRFLDTAIDTAHDRPRTWHQLVQAVRPERGGASKKG